MVDALVVVTRLGPTRVHAAGPRSGTPMLLISGGGARSPVWADVVGALTATHRVLALDVPGDAGMSPPPKAKPRTKEAVAGWLADVLGALSLDRVIMVGHSYGAWLALIHALHYPARVKHLVLLDPTDCFTRPAASYLVRALPLFLAPSARRHRTFLTWETRGRGINPDAATLGADQGRPAVLLRPTPPTPQELGALRMPVSVLLAELSRAHDVDAVARAVRTRLPGAGCRVPRSASWPESATTPSPPSAPSSWLWRSSRPRAALDQPGSYR